MVKFFPVDHVNGNKEDHDYPMKLALMNGVAVDHVRIHGDYIGTTDGNHPVLAYRESYFSIWGHVGPWTRLSIHPCCK